MILSSYLFGVIEDNIQLLSVSRMIKGISGCSEYLGYPTGTCVNLAVNNQPFINISSFLLAQLIGSVFAYNLLVLLGLGLTLLFSYRFFKKLFGHFLGGLIAVVFLMSPYFAYQSRSHYDLLQFWPAIWFLDTLFFSTSKYKSIFLGLLLTLTVGVSNYLGYFTLLFTTLYLLSVFLISKDKAAFFKRNIGPLLKGFLVFVVTSSVFLFPYLKSNFLNTADVPNDIKVLDRPFEDFIIFSSRPWYYLLPSVDNPFLGDISEKTLTYLARGGNYLTQNYFKAEHSALFLGWVNVAVGLLGVLFLSKKTNKTPLNMKGIFIALGMLIIFMMPPLVVVNGLSSYMPSLLLFKLFPMFRVLARAGVFILFIFLILVGYSYQNLMHLKNVSPKLIRVLVLILVMCSFLEFYIPLKITHVGVAPKVFSYLGEDSSTKSPIVVYPYSKATNSLFWFPSYRKPLINPRYYADSTTGFVSEEFTKRLPSSEGLQEARNRGAQYLVYFYEADSGKSLPFFDKSLLLKKVSAFSEDDLDEKDFGLYKVVEAGPSKSNSAILYRFLK